MSSPTSGSDITASFATMAVTTRGQSRRQQVPRDESDGESMSEHPESVSGETSEEYDESDKEDQSDEEEQDSDLEVLADHIKSKNSGVTYDLTGFDPAARRRFHAGMTANCAVNFVQVNQVGDRSAVMFTVSENSTVKVGVPVNGGGAARCNCSDYSQGRICKHIYWLGDLWKSAALADTSPRAQVPAESLRNWSFPVSEVSGPAFRRVISDYKWILIPQGQSLPSVSSEQVNDSLDLFEPNDLLGAENIDDRQDPVPKTRRIYSEKYALFRRAINGVTSINPPLASILCWISSEDLQAKAYFEKIWSRTRKALQLLGERVKTGPTHSKAAGDVRRTAVEQTADVLEDLAKKVAEGFNDRILRAQDPNVRQAATDAFRVILEMLYEISVRNKDQYAGVAWAETSREQAYELQSYAPENNLFVKMIGREGDEGQQGMLMISVLQLIQKNSDPIILRQHLERLKTVEDKFQVEGAPQRFLGILSSVTRAVSGKRSAVDVAGGSSSRQRSS